MGQHRFAARLAAAGLLIEPLIPAYGAGAGALGRTYRYPPIVRTD